MTDDEIIAVVQARKEGRKIQSRSSEEYYGHKAKESDWSDCCSVTWDFYHVDYRVAPEPPATAGKLQPREWRVPLKGGEVCHNSVADEIVHVREVIE